MASIKVLVAISLILVIQFGINPVTGQGFNPNGGNTLSSRQTRQSGRSRSSALIDILLINSLAELDHDIEIEVPVYFNPSLTGSTSSGMIPFSTTPKKKKKKKSSNNSYYNGGSASLASLFCAYCAQFGFNLCVSRYCFIDFSR